MTNNNEIEKRLWEAAEQLRANSGLKYSQFSRPILGLIFLKYADYKFIQAKKKFDYEKKSKTSKSTIDGFISRKKIAPSDYKANGIIYLPENTQYSHILNLPESENIGKTLNQAMKEIENKNEDLRGVLDIEYNEIEDSILVALLKLFSEIDFRYSDDIFGKIYEYFLGKFAMGEGQRGGEFFTPESLVKLIVEILSPKKGRIFDPACGSGGMFVQSANYIKRYGKDPMNEISVWGQEKTLETVKLCKMNLAVHGISGEILQGNTYYEDLHESLNKFDFVMANPPFNVSGVNKKAIKTDKRFTYDIPRADNANYLWIQIFLNSLNEHGRGGFVMPNIATDAGQSEFEIRKRIVDDKFIDIIIAIGPNFFFNVTLPCDLWFIDKSGKEKVLFIDVREVYIEIDRVHKSFSPAQIEFISNIVKLYRKKKIEHNFGSKNLIKKYFPNNVYRDVPELCKVATIEDIKKKNYSLNPGRYIGIRKENVRDIDFYKKMQKYYNKFMKLNEQARNLEELIEKNISNILKNTSRNNDE